MISVTQVFLCLQCMSIIGINAEPLVGPARTVQLATRDELPFAASLGVVLRDNNWRHYCGGILITEWYAFTTKRCFDTVSREAHDRHGGKPVKVKVGSHDVMQSTVYDIESDITYNALVAYMREVHENVYCDILNIHSVDPSADMVFLKLGSRAPERYQAKFLHPRNGGNVIPEQVKVAGWGGTAGATTARSSRYLRKGSLYVAGSTGLTFTMRGATIEAGDAGGPVFDADRNLVGIVAHSDNAFHHISPYREAIRSLKVYPPQS